MDLTIPIGNIILNIRVAVLLKTRGGFILEKNKQGFYFPIGGRVKAGETSNEASQREVLEELGIVVTDLKFKGIAELFFESENGRVQEICFVYSAPDVDDLKLSSGQGTYTLEQIESMDFRPQILKQILQTASDEVLHLTTDNIGR